MKNAKTEIITIVALALLCVVIFGLILLLPLALIWALNTLFGLGIAYTGWNWVAALVITSTFGNAGRIGSKKSA